ncbi:hypothetical protein A3H10_00860, partial [Candidatus Uhrbacteria bacterium RIFCSPLOWO2_12_FULL_46_10]
MLGVLNYYVNFGRAEILLLFFFGLISYLFLRFLTLLVQKIFWRAAQEPFSQQLLLKSAFSFCLLILLSLVVVGLAMKIIDTPASVAKIAAVDNFLMAADKEIFGVYVPFWFQSNANALKPLFDWLSAVLIATYLSLGTVLAAVFIFVLAVNSQKFYQMFLAFLLSIVLSLPFWYFFPSLSPLEGYIENVPGVLLPADISEAAFSYRPNDDLKIFFVHVKSVKANMADNFMAVTTMPSMHVAWATIALYFGALTWAALVYFLAPFYILTFIAAVYTMQHYAVDTFAGALIAVAAITVVKKFAKTEPPLIISELSAQVRRGLNFLASRLRAIRLRRD